jgi:hypothetical protein
MAILVIVFCLTACAPEETTNKNNGEQSGVEQNSGTDTYKDGLFKGEPTHISQAYSDTFEVEADVNVPNITKFDELFAEYMPYDEQKLLDILFTGKDPKREESPNDKLVCYEDETSYLTLAGGHMTYANDEYSYIEFPTDSFSTNSDILSGSGFERFDKVYTKENLVFMSQDEAVKTAAEMVKRLSINVSEMAEVYAIDYETLQKQQDKRIQENIDYYNSIEGEENHSPTYGYKTKSQFTQDDEFYIICLTIEQDKIPITQQSYNLTATDRIIEGTKIKIYLSKNGVIYMECGGIYQKQDVAEVHEEVVTVEDMLQKVLEINNSIIFSGKTVVMDINFEYVPVPYNENFNEVKLIPAWCIILGNETSANNSKDTNAVFGEVLFINAITGEEIK